MIASEHVLSRLFFKLHYALTVAAIMREFKILARDFKRFLKLRGRVSFSFSCSDPDSVLANQLPRLISVIRGQTLFL